jgi:3-hydroxybutyryl-CoA dehydrogenase
MGAGIAEVAARSGCDVVVLELDEAGASVGRERIAMSLARCVGAGKLSGEQRELALDRLQVTTDPGDLGDRQIVIEAVIEDEREKVRVFELLDTVVEDSAAVLASNTSSIPIMKLAMATNRPDRVLGIHFFNPVPVLPLVEVITSLLTSDETREMAESCVTNQLGKQVIRSQDRAGFVVNALLVPYLLSAIRMLESGFATRDDIDTGMVLGCAHPMGPLALADLIGLDTLAAVAESLYTEFKEPLYAASPMLSRMVEADLLGRKRGRGFYEYAA